MKRTSLFLLFPLFCLLVFVFAPFGVTSAAEALNVAVLPPINTDKYGDAKVIEKVQTKVVRHFRYPFYEKVPQEEISGALLKDSSLKDKKPYSKEALQSISEKLPADIVVVVEFAKVRSYLYERRWHGDTYEKIDVVLNCYTYSVQDDKYEKTTVSAHNFDVLSVFGGLDTVVPNLTDDLLKKIPYTAVLAW